METVKVLGFFWADARCLETMLPESNITVDDIINDLFAEASISYNEIPNFEIDYNDDKY